MAPKLGSFIYQHLIHFNGDKSKWTNWAMAVFAEVFMYVQIYASWYEYFGNSYRYISAFLFLFRLYQLAFIYGIHHAIWFFYISHLANSMGTDDLIMHHHLILTVINQREPIWTICHDCIRSIHVHDFVFMILFLNICDNDPFFVFISHA
jgi:hypothetical protein